jgi:sugar-specific transcriptional regulator TrmB
VLIKDLVEFGLGDKEARIYLKLLELEVAGVQELAKATHINRSTIYVTLESLQKKGLVSESQGFGIQRYVASSPEMILRSAQDAANATEHMRTKIESILPEMKALFKGTKKKPLVKVFEGKEGLISAFEISLNNKEKLMRIWSSPFNLGKVVSDYLPIYIKKRLDLGIKMIGIHPDTVANLNFSKIKIHPEDVNILIPSSKFNFTADLAIFDNKISYMSGEQGGLAVVIESREISTLMKSIFDLAFKEAQRMKSKKLPIKH